MGGSASESASVFYAIADIGSAIYSAHFFNGKRLQSVMAGGKLAQ
jgi:hypothetical protein